MKKRILAIIIIIAVSAAAGIMGYRLLERTEAPSLPAPPPYQLEGAPGAPEGAFTAIVRTVSPSVVNISAEKLVRHGSPEDDPFYDFFKDFFSPLYEFGLKRNYTERSTGSGVIVSPEGYILTNNHVISEARKIKVTLLDKRSFEARVVGVDTKTDLAVLKISAEGLPYIRWGDSDKIQVGDFALAVGNPFGLSHTVTMGIISAVGRANIGIVDYEDFIQTDAAINPGNSGGPLVNAQGELVGINTAIFSKSGGYQGIGFAVPSNMARMVLEQLVASGRVVRGWLGVSIQEITPPLARAFSHDSMKGAIVTETVPGSPAEKAGLTHGDIILSFNGMDVSEPANLRNLVARSSPGEQAELRVLRKGSTVKVRATVGELPQQEEIRRVEHAREKAGEALSGLSVIELTGDIASQLGLQKGAQGVVVANVEEGTPAHDAGLSRGDVIHEVGGRKITSLKDFQLAARELSPVENILMYVSREGRKFYITLLVS